MDIFFKIVSFEPFWTVICGVIVFVMCEVYKEICLSVVKKYRQIKIEIAEALILYANVFTQPVSTKKENADACSEKMRELAAKTEGIVVVRNWYILGVPRKYKLKIALQGLIGISNGFTYIKESEDILRKNNKDRVVEIRKALGL